MSITKEANVFYGFVILQHEDVDTTEIVRDLIRETSSFEEVFMGYFDLDSDSFKGCGLAICGSETSVTPGKGFKQFLTSLESDWDQKLKEAKEKLIFRGGRLRGMYYKNWMASQYLLRVKTVTNSCHTLGPRDTIRYDIPKRHKEGRTH